MDRYQEASGLSCDPNRICTDNAEGRDSDVQSYKAKSMIMPKNVLVVVDGSIGNKEALASVRRAGTLLDVQEKAVEIVAISAKK